MEYSVIRLCIFKHIINIPDILNLCIIDKLAIKLCSTKAFWVTQSNKQGFDMGNTVYIEYYKWIEEFLCCQQAIMGSTNLINCLSQCWPYYFTIINYHLHNYTSTLASTLSMTSCRISYFKYNVCYHKETIITKNVDVKNNIFKISAGISNNQRLFKIDDIRIYKDKFEYYFALYLKNNDGSDAIYYQYIMNKNQIINILYIFYRDNLLKNRLLPKKLL